ncbi:MULTISPECIES: hypothetical protein [Clostridium]|uniref:Uncharacterized protein n=1 Tax=Candidatus Clostridium helianthi TaxID=3381660 RepID=A0ABW8S5H4_9CLOT|nr:hypothetical protein [Clostridium beijerinckii]MBA8935515.1 hypothetical protein [Clostridium beijerinckii]NRU39910.1 hypothetical protein [Clostridium beijerinckii]NSA96811.1 hypothetical protein [Clostridium beijerinckii]OOM56864.1 hypothetical protein CLOBI_42090 [Clostridium beijerinckii]OOM64898.1 hypothetical protein CLBEIC_54180 [Clostridium beijerinckii]
MKTLVIYDNEGYIYLQLTSENNRIPQGGINYLEVEVPVGKYIKSIDVSITPNEPIYEDMPKTDIEKLQEQVENLAQANAELTSIVAMGKNND